MGFIIGPIILVYILVSFFISRLIYKISKREILSVVSFLIIVSFPFWDLIAQKTIKEIYIFTKALEPKIYAYPEKDENGRIDGLDLSNVVPRGNYWLEKKDSTKILLVDYYSFSESSELKSLDLSFRYGEYPDFIYKIFNFSYENGNNMPSFIQIEKSKARYKIIEKTEDRFFGLYNLSEYEVIDEKNSQVLAKSNGISFPDNYAYFRENILFLVKGNGVGMYYVSSVGGWGDLIKIFNLKFRAY